MSWTAERAKLARVLGEKELRDGYMRSALRYYEASDNLRWIAADQQRRADPTWRPGDRWEDLPWESSVW